MRTIRIIIFLLITQFAFGQSDSEVSITSKHKDILYIGMDNSIIIKTEGIKVDDLMFTISAGRIKRMKDGGIIVNVRNRGKATLKVVYNNKIIGTKEFNCFGVPDPATALKVGEKSYKYGEISKEDLLKAEKLTGDIGPNFDIKFTVTKFTVSIKVNGLYLSKKASSEDLTEEQKQLFQEVKKGTKIYFDDVFCIGPDGSQRALPGLVLSLK